jgi:phosphoglycolate phosphatase
MKCRGVLFDLDGTLLDTLQDLADSMNAALVRLGAEPHETAFYRTAVGDGMEMLALRSLPESRRDPASVAVCASAMRDEYGRRWAAATRPYPGIPELLDRLAERRATMAILSNKPHDFTTAIVDALLGRWPFAAVLGGRPGRPRKPDPAEALAIAGDLGITPAGWLYVGDTNTDMETARAAGMRAVGALWGFRTEQELLAHGALRTAAHPLQILDLLEVEW